MKLHNLNCVGGSQYDFESRSNSPENGSKIFEFHSFGSLSGLAHSRQNSPGSISPNLHRVAKPKQDSNAVTLATAETGSHNSRDFHGLKLRGLNSQDLGSVEL